MAISIINNTASLNAQAALSKTNLSLSNSLSRLSSGLRINSAQDPSAAFAVAQALASKTNAMASAQRNTHDAVGLTQTLEGGLSSTTEVLMRMRSLAAQASNDTMTAADRDFINEDFSTLKSEALRIAGGASYNGENLLALDSGAPKNIVIGAAKLDQRQVALISNGNPDDGILTRSYDGFSLASDAFNIAGSSSAQQREGVLNALDRMISDVSTARYALGAFQNEVLSPVSYAPTETDPGVYSPAVPRIPDHDHASELENLRNRTLQSGASILSQANQLPQLAFSLMRG